MSPSIETKLARWAIWQSRWWVGGWQIIGFQCDPGCGKLTELDSGRATEWEDVPCCTGCRFEIKDPGQARPVYRPLP